MTLCRVSCAECGGQLHLELFRRATDTLMCMRCKEETPAPPDVCEAAMLALGIQEGGPTWAPLCNDCGEPANPQVHVGCKDGMERDLCEACAAIRAAAF